MPDPVPTAPTRRRGSYGVDAPYLLPIPAALIIANVVDGLVSKTVWPFIAAALIAACAGLGFYASKRGKFVVWARLLKELELRGDEQVLDLGCGRGAVLLMAAQSLTTGRAVGVDLWRKADQWGNAKEATWRNAEAERVADRVELHTADMTSLPFENARFDLVVSNLAMHNVKGKEGRRRAVEEAVRVLRSEGQLMIADILATREYEASCARLGLTGLRRQSLGWRMWWSGPWLTTYLVSGVKAKAFNAKTSEP